MRTVTVNNTLKYHPSYKGHMDDANTAKDMLLEAMNHIDKYMVLPADFSVILKPLRGNTHGRWFNSRMTMYIDPRQSRGRNLGSILSTYVHELAHAEQYFTGKLSYDVIKGHLWNKTSVYAKTRTLSFKKYYSLPWEVDARDKQDKLTPLLASDIIKSWSTKNIKI